MSLRWKLALSLAAIGALVASAFGVAAYVLTENRLLAEVDRSLERTVETIADRGQRLPPGARPENRIDRFGTLDVYAVQQINPDGEIVGGTGVTYLPVDREDRRIAARGFGSQVRTDEVDETAVRIQTIGIRGGGALLLGRDLAETERVLSTLAWWTLALVIMATLGSALIGWLLAWRMTRPLVELTGTAERVAVTDDLDTNVPDEGSDEVGRLAGAFRNMLASLRSARDQQRRLVQDASHELRTPLTSIRTNTAVLRKYPDLDPAERERILQDLNTEVEELVALVDELVDAAVEGRSDEATTAVDLVALAASVAARVERRSGHRIEVEGAPWSVSGQQGQLERALSNLLENAVKFDGGDVPITCRIEPGRITVIDHGPGIADADKAQVFERFFRTDSARSAPGSGLGLAIVRDIARAHGGDVFVGDTPGGGLSIGFTLPIAS